MTIFTLLVFVLVSVVSIDSCVDDSISDDDCLRKDFEIFKIMYGKEYKNEDEEMFRMMVFSDNQKRIKQHNQRYQDKKEKFTMAMNEFGDMLLQEFLQGRPISNEEVLEEPDDGGSNDTSLNERGTEGSPLKVPLKMDWRKHGAVSDVQQEGKCKASWAFAATGALEAQHFRRFGALVELSAQNLIDCVSPGSGCYGSLSSEDAITYIYNNEGISTADTYPYEGADGVCRFDENNIGATCAGVRIVSQGSELKLLKAVAHIGPMFVSVDAAHDSFKHYSKGIYYESRCSSTQLNHKMLVVGYGTDDQGTPYWIAKNSWGTDWGIDGYIYMARYQSNNCGIASRAGYPPVDFDNK